MNSQRASVVLILLSLIFFSLITNAWIFQNNDLAFLQAAPVVLQVDYEDYPLRLGQISFQILFFVLGAMVLHTLNELFGKKSALYLCLFTAMLVAFKRLLVGFIVWLPLMANPNIIGGSGELFPLGNKDIYAIIGALAIGFTSLAFLYDLFRRWTGGKYTIVRLFFSSLIGMAVLTTVYEYAHFGLQFKPGEYLSQWITHYVQLFVLSLFCLPLYYTLEFFFGLLVGKDHYNEVKKRFLKKPLFRQKEEQDYFESKNQMHAQRI